MARWPSELFLSQPLCSPFVSPSNFVKIGHSEVPNNYSSLARTAAGSIYLQMRGIQNNHQSHSVWSSKQDFTSWAKADHGKSEGWALNYMEEACEWFKGSRDHSHRNTCKILQLKKHIYRPRKFSEISGWWGTGKESYSLVHNNKSIEQTYQTEMQALHRLSPVVASHGVGHC